MGKERGESHRHHHLHHPLSPVREHQPGVCHPLALPGSVTIPIPHQATGPVAPGLSQRPRVFLVSILEAFAVKTALVGEVKLQELLCYVAADGTQPKPQPRACWPEVAGSGGHWGCFIGHRVHQVPTEPETGPEAISGGVGTGASTSNLNVLGSICQHPFPRPLVVGSERTSCYPAPSLPLPRLSP